MQSIMESIFVVSYHPQHPLCGHGRDDCGALAAQRPERPDAPVAVAGGAAELPVLLPVLLFADALPSMGMMMLPKTCMYIWMMVMFLRLPKET